MEKAKKYDFPHFIDNATGKRFAVDVSYKIGGRWYIYTTVFCDAELWRAIKNAYETDGVTEVKTKMRKQKED